MSLYFCFNAQKYSKTIKGNFARKTTTERKRKKEGFFALNWALA